MPLLPNAVLQRRGTPGEDSVRACLQGTATISGDIDHDLSKAKALSNALVVMSGELSAAKKPHCRV